MPVLALEDGDVWYETVGEGTPLVFVHGGWMNADAWRAQVDRFAGEYRVVTLDLRGHGRTGATDRRRYSVGLFADDLERLLDHLDVERPVLCGLSLGGMVVQEYLARHPDRALGAVVAGPVRSMPPVDLPSAVKPFLSPLPGLAASLSFVGPTATFHSMLASIRTTTGGPWLTVDPAVESWAMDAVGDVSPDEFRKVFSALYTFDPPDLSHVVTPTLVLYGEREAAPVKRQGERIAATVVDGRWREIPGAGHLVNQDNPEAFNAAVGEFLAGLDA
ncbi:alpha/beta fold hydrolase [Halobacteriaceae archaeon GCM10025711]